MFTIEKKMIQAIESGKLDWKLDNTRVMAIVGGFEVQLHGNRIATIDEYGQVKVDIKTIKECPTSTATSRLRALGINVKTKGCEVYLDGVKI